jgi:hypothetical protein
MTGTTRGLGAHALRHLVAMPDTKVIVGVRGTGPDAVEAIPLDLASLRSVRSFAEAVKQRLGTSHIDMLVLNAGAQYRRAAQRSADGFEATFAVNHLAHCLLARLLLLSMADVRTRHMQVIAFNPGLTFGTKLGRSESQRQPMSRPATPSPVVRAIFRFLSMFRSPFYPGILERAGEVLAQLTLGTVASPPGRIYVSLVRGEVTFQTHRNSLEATRRATAYGAKARSWSTTSRIRVLTSPLAHASGGLRRRALARS